MKTIMTLLIVLASSVCYGEESTSQNHITLAGDPATLRVENDTISAHAILGYTIRGKDTLSSIIHVQCSSVDGDGTILATGGFWGTVCFGDSIRTSMKSYDCFVARYAPNGTLLWLRVIATYGNEFGHSVAPDSSGRVHVVGVLPDSNSIRFEFPKRYPSMIGTDGFWASFDPTGTICKVKIIVSGFGTNAAFSVATDKDRNLYVTGVFRGTATIGGKTCTATGINDSLGDVFMLKIAPNGNYLITQTYGTEYADERGVRIVVSHYAEQVGVYYDIDTLVIDSSSTQDSRSSMGFIGFRDYGMHPEIFDGDCYLCRDLYARKFYDALKARKTAIR